jgi:DNA-binding winged helix-turn-helix (wHTH) protein/tetratricopeptide (TPR) repeat protein
VFRFAGFELDPDRAELRGTDGNPIKLRRKPFDMLALFVASAGRVLSKPELIDAIWPNVHVGEDSLFQCIREIRAALNDEQRQLLKVVPGRGYVFDVEVETAAPGVPTPAKAVSEADVVPDIPARPRETAQQRWFGLPRSTARVLVAGAGAIIGLVIAVAFVAPGLIFKPTPPTIAVMPITAAGGDAQTAAMAAGVTDRLIDGLAKIENIRVIAVRAADAAQPPSADFVVNGDLHKGEHAWSLQARMIKTATREVQPMASVSVETKDIDLQLQQSRLAAGVGHPLAQRLNALLESGAPPAGPAKVVIEQAMASINQTSKERFAALQKMLEEALANVPDNVDLQVALASLQLRGVMMVWYSPADSAAAEANAKTVLERAARTRPNSIPVLEAYCRFLVATNHFVETLPACTRILSFDPWNGQALYNIGLAQINLGRFEDALAAFKQADRFDTPQVSRWTWLLGAGWANMLIGNPEDAVQWLERSIAITPASGRSHMLLAAAYQQLGRLNEAKAAMEKGLKLRPGTNAINYPPPTKNASPVYLAGSERLIRAIVAAGLPER